MNSARLPRNAALFALACGLGTILTAAPAMAANNCQARISASNQTVTEGTPNVGLDGTASTPKKSDWTYQWSQLSGPTVTLSSTTAPQPTFTAPSVGSAGASLVFQLKLLNCDNTNGDNIITTTISVLNINDPPFAIATITPTSAHEGNLVSLNGSASYDPDGTAITHAWTQIGGAAVTLSNANAAIASFTAPNTAYPSGASFTFRLTVSDGTLTAQTDKIVSVIWDNDAPVAQVTCPTVPVKEGDPVVLNGGASTDLENNAAGVPLVYAWIQIEGPPNLPVSVLTPTPTISFNAPQLGYQNTGFLKFGLLVTDSLGLQSSKECTLQIRDVTAPLISGASSFSVEATSATGASVSYSPTVFDNVDGNSLATCSPLSPVQFALGPHTVSCSAHDSAVPQNTAAASFVVTVVDTTAPVIAPPLPVTAEAAGAAGSVVSYGSPATADAVDGAGTATCLPASGSTFAIGANTVDCNAVDAHGNHAATTHFTVTVGDSVAPHIVPPPDQTFDATGVTTPLTSANYGIPTVTDLVGVTEQSNNAPAAFPLGPTKITWHAEDFAGNSSVASTIITLKDNSAPTLILPADITTEATSGAGAIVSFTATADDVIDGPLTVTCTPPSDSTFAVATTPVNCSASDNAGNTGSGSFRVTVVDTTAPALILPTNLIREATGADGAAVTFTAEASDLVDGPLAVDCSATSGTTFALGSTTVSCSATDQAGNTATGGFVVTVEDTTAPVLSLPSDITAEASSAAGAAVPFTATATDVVDGTVAVVCTPDSGTTFALGSTLANCSATDHAANTRTGSFNVLVQDTTPPTLTLPSDLVAEASSASGATVLFTASATDLVDGIVAVSCAPDSGSTFGLGSTTVNCSATDHATNSTSSSFHVLVEDTTPPVLTLPTDIIAEATSASGAVVPFLATASDVVDGNVAVMCNPAAASTFGLGTTTVQCNTTDHAGNPASGNFQVLVRDTTPPALILPSNLILEATGPAGAVATFTATASDLVDGSVTVNCSATSGSTFGLGNTTVNCSATDAVGNNSGGSFVVTVEDTTAPVLSLPADIIAEATSGAGGTVSYTASATDLVDGTVAVSCSPNSGSTFALGSTTVNCSATDGAGNTRNGSFHVTVEDTTPPTLTLPANITAEATSALGAAVTFSATASDLVDGAVAVSCSPTSGSIFGLGDSTVRCSATDDAANTASGNFHVLVRDTTPPALTLPSNLILEATGPAGAVATFTATANDLVDGSVAVNCSAASGSTFALGSTTVNCSATDAIGNTGHGSFVVTVRDTTAPALEVPANIVQEASNAAGAAVSFVVTASDMVDSSVAILCSPASGSTFALGSTTVNCTGTDDANNVGHGSFSVTVRDTTAPTLTVPGTLLREATSAAGAAVSFVVTGHDAVDSSVTILCSPASGSTFALGGTTVICTGTDDAGNVGSGSFGVTVRDTTAPTLTLPGTLVREATSAAGAAVSFVVTGNDAVDSSVAILCSPASGSTFALGGTTVNCTGTDDAGNVGSGSFGVTVRDTTGPTISAHADVNALAAANSKALVSYTLPTASDLVDGARPVSCTPASGAEFSVGTTAIVCTSTDVAGNVSQSSFNVIVSFAWSGFFSPVDNLPTVNSVKAGSAIPVKFSLGGNQGLNIFATGYPRSVVVGCSSGDPTDIIEETVTAGGSSLSYGNGQYVYVWKTDKSWVGSCRQLQVKLTDGSLHVASFIFK